MEELLNQLGLDHSFFIELALCAVLFPCLAKSYFNPFLKLLKERERRKQEDQDHAQKLMAQATAQMEEYRRLLTEEQHALKQKYDVALLEAKQQESHWIAQARSEAEGMTQAAMDSIHQQANELRTRLDSEVHVFAQSVAEKLLSRKL